MGSVALGTKVFNRANKLENLLDSVDSSVIDSVYIADDGEMNNKKKEIYNNSYDFELSVFDLEYDAGVGYGRKKIVDELSEEYLLVVDTDHVLPHNIDILQDQLEEDPELGGVGGILMENDEIRAQAHDLYELDNILIRDINGNKNIITIGKYPFVEFDFIPNAAMFRASCLEDYCWDKNYVIGSEHLDFYVGHKYNTNWKFGINPEVLIRHEPGGDNYYLRNRHSSSKLKNSREYFMNKWDFDEELYINGHWFDTSHTDKELKQTIATHVKKSICNLPSPLRWRTVSFLNEYIL